jgi:membrane protease YdiL (CAAX protease family)
MLAVYTPGLQIANLASLGVGALLLLGFVWHLGRRGELSLRTAAHLPDDVGGLHVVIALCVFLLATVVATQVVALRVPASSPAVQTPGTAEWHLYLVPDFVSKAAASAMCLVLLWRGRAPGQAAKGTLPARLGLGLLAGFALTPAVIGLAEVLEHVWRMIWPAGPEDHMLLQALHHSAWGRWGQFQIAFSAIVVAPISEELFFRGLVQAAVQRVMGNVWMAIAFSAVTWGVIHFATPVAILPLIVMGFGLGWLRVWSNSLVPGMVAHALFNARTIALALAAPELLNEPA